MGQVDIGARETKKVVGLLRDVGTATRASSDVRLNANRWALAMRRKMDRRDLQTLSWLLSEMSGDRRLSNAARRDARYWAMYLEARL